MLNVTSTDIWITDGNLNKITKITTPFPLNSGGSILQYSKELDDFGQCKFRVSSYDTTLSTYGDILVPHKNWVQIWRGGILVWQGAIIENTKRTKDFIEVVAAEPLWYLSKVMIQRSSPDPSYGGATATGTALDNIYRIFGTDGTGASYMGGSLTMSTAVTTIMNETITTFKGANNGHALAGMTLGTVTNPNFPPNMTDGNNPPNPLTGGWRFGNGVNAPRLQFDFQTVLYVLQNFGVYTYSDFYLDNSLVFNFVPFKGNNLTQKVTFNWGGPQDTPANIIDYNLPRFGQRMVNHLYGIATDPNGIVLHYDQYDTGSVTTYGLIEGVAAYTDVKDQSTLNARIQAEVPLISAPDNTAISIVLNEKGYPLGYYDVGDIVQISIKNKAVNFSDQRRIVGISVSLHNTGRETTTVQTNKPQAWQIQSLGSPQ